MRRLCTLSVLAVAAAGCGASEQQKIQATLRAWDKAFERGDSAAACALMTEALRRVWQQTGGATSCREAIDRTLAPPSSDELSLTATISEIEPNGPAHIRVAGDTAVVYYGHGPGDRLRRVRGRWLIDASPP